MSSGVTSFGQNSWIEEALLLRNERTATDVDRLILSDRETEIDTHSDDYILPRTRPSFWCKHSSIVGEISS